MTNDDAIGALQWKFPRASLPFNTALLTIALWVAPVALLAWGSQLLVLFSRSLEFLVGACRNWGNRRTKIHYHWPIWSAYVLHITMPIELCITYPEMLVFAHTRLAIVSGPLMPCWETTCIDFLCDAHLHQTFLFVRFKCLMHFTNLHFPQLFNAPVWWRPNAVVVQELFRCLRLISTLLLLCSKNMWTLCTHQAQKSKKCWESVLLLSRLDTY